MNCYLCGKPLYEEDYYNKDTCLPGIRVHRTCDQKIQRNDKKIMTRFMASHKASHKARHEHLARNISRYYPQIKVHIEHWAPSVIPAPLVKGTMVRLDDALITKYHAIRYMIIAGMDSCNVQLKPHPRSKHTVSIPLSLSELLYCVNQGVTTDQSK